MKSRKSFSLRFLVPAVVVSFVLPTLYVRNVSRNTRNDLSNYFKARRLPRNIAMRTNNVSSFSDSRQQKTNCVEPSINDFPSDFMSQHLRRQGAVVVHVLIALYLFGALAIVCDDYFVQSLERICDDLKLKNDVAGATFMAAGSSAPEFFTSVIGVFITEGDIGLGTIVGSAVFNILFIVAVCGLFSGRVLKLGWWPLTRDCVYYMLSIAALVVVTYDSKVYWYEALVLVIMYLIYVLIMYFNTKLEIFFISIFNHQDQVAAIYNEEENKSLMDNDDFKDSSQDSIEKGEVSPTEVDVISFGSEDYETTMSRPTGFVSVLIWLLFLPFSFLFFITIPNCRNPRWRRWYFLTFVMSVLWISGLSYLLVWMVEIIGYTLQIPDVVMGLTFLAAGSSVPDGISSLLVARQGEGDMAVSNTVGSNIFDILLCLGVPWLLKTTAINLGSTVTVISGSIIYSSVSLFGTVVVTVFLFGLNQWNLNKCLGGIFLVLYLAFISVATLFELNIFGDFNVPVCKS